MNTEERFPVWDALSEFFLDTDLQEEDYDRIAGTLAASQYSIPELREILDFEVYPACKWNLCSVAGEWAGFSREWILENIGPRKGKRPRFRFPRLNWWMLKDHWNSVVGRIEKIRKKR